MRTSSTIPDRAPAPLPGARIALAVGLLALGLAGGCAHPVGAAGGAPVEAVPRLAAPSPDRGALDEAVARLARADFSERARASRELVAAGTDALPALGRAGEMPVVAAGGVAVSATQPVLAAVLAQVPTPAVAQSLSSPWPTVRRAAAAELGARDSWGVVPRLIERLDDPDAGVRAASAAALRRLTNNFFGFRARAHVTARREARDRWRTWWSLEGRNRAGERDGGPQAGR